MNSTPPSLFPVCVHDFQYLFTEGGPWVDSASNRNEYQEYFLGGEGGQCVGLTTLPPLCANCLQIGEP